MRFIKLFVLFSLVMLPNFLFGAGWEDAMEVIKNFIGKITEVIPMIVKLAIMFFAIVCLLIIPIAAYFVSLNKLKKMDERNDSDVSSTTTHAKAVAFALLGFIGGMFLFQLVAVYGLGLDESIGGGYGNILKAVLMLNY